MVRDFNSGQQLLMRHPLTGVPYLRPGPRTHTTARHRVCASGGNASLRSGLTMSKCRSTSPLALPQHTASLVLSHCHRVLAARTRTFAAARRSWVRRTWGPRRRCRLAHCRLRPLPPPSSFPQGLSPEKGIVRDRGWEWFRIDWNRKPERTSRLTGLETAV